MKTITATVTLLAMLAQGSAHSMKYFSNNTDAQKYSFRNFKEEFGKTYETPEAEETAFAVFVANLRLIDARNAEELEAGGNAVHGITKFADISPEDFKARFLTSLPREGPVTVEAVPPLPEGSSIVQDWRGIYTTPVKNQGYCGSCWAFSATEQIESDYWRNGGEETILSPQQITSCDKTSFGCNGGTTESAYKYVSNAGGLETEDDYPYTSGKLGVTGSCDSNSKDYVVGITGYTTVSSSSRGESSMATYVGETGPLSICVDAESWSSYTGGIKTVCGNSVDHCVQAVGIDTSASTPYWIVRNSWGVTWGEAGYIYLEYGKNLCDLASDATYVTGTYSV
jgi:hypothetical protein